MSDWQAKAFKIVVRGQDGEPTHRDVAGWVSGSFALDFRVYNDGEGGYQHGFALSHLPTGRNICGLFLELDSAKDFADEIAALGDWDAAEIAHGLGVAAAGMIGHASDFATREPAAFSAVFRL